LKSSAKKIELASVDDLFSTEESRADAQRERVLEIPLSELHPFKNHPFKVKDDEAMLETADSIKQYGVLVPAIARPDPEGGYELVAGHRRHRASELAEKETMPVIVRDLDDDAATIIMVDSNLQRESLLPSERAFAYKMKLEAMKHQGERVDLTGLMFCADCGAKMYNHRGKAGKARDWAGRPNGKRRPDRDEYNCSRYDLGNQRYDTYCTTHLIRTVVVNELLLEAIKEVCNYAQNNEAAFIEQVCSASGERQKKAIKTIRQRKQRSEKRADELSRLIRKLYEDNVNGKLSDKLFEQMLHDFELELDGLNTSITQDQQELDRISSESVNAEKFIALVKRYTDFSELTPAMINEFIEKILVHQAEGKGASRTQEIEIFFNFVGKVEIPHEEVELTEEEIAAIAEQERRRAKKAEYNRRYMQKKRKQWKEQQEQAQEPQEPIELPLVQDEKGALSA